MKEPYKITITHWGESISIEKDRSDLTIDEVLELFINVAVASGFNKKQVEEAIVSYQKKL
jgi:hypothetical protein